MSLHYNALKNLRAPGTEDRLRFRVPRENVWHWTYVNSLLRNREGPDS